MLRDIKLFGDPVLRTPAEPVIDFDLELRNLIADLTETMLDAPGVGLAAPQVAIGKRVFVMDVHDDEHPPAVVINPKIVLAEDEEEMTEGCLSVLGYVGEIVRFKRIAVTGLDRYGEKIRIEGEGLVAQCLQHEIDHLDGVLYVDKAKNIRPAVTEEEVEIAEAAAAEAT